MVTRKTVKTLITFACVIALALVFNGCRKDSEQPDDELTTREGQSATKATTDDTSTSVQPPKRGDEPMVAVPLVGLGPVKFGMSKEEVIEILGQPGRMEGGGIGMYYLESVGIHLRVDPRRGVHQINCWSKDYPMAPPELVNFAGKTDKGIAMGDGREQIVAAYGEPDKTETKATIETLYYGELGTRFALVQGRLANIMMTAP